MACPSFIWGKEKEKKKKNRRNRKCWQRGLAWRRQRPLSKGGPGRLSLCFWWYLLVWYTRLCFHVCSFSLVLFASTVIFTYDPILIFNLCFYYGLYTFRKIKLLSSIPICFDRLDLKSFMFLPYSCYDVNTYNHICSTYSYLLLLWS